MRFSFSFILAMLLATLPGAALAQSLDALTSADPFTVSIQPLYPAPGSSASMTVLSSNIDLSSAVMDVVVAGEILYHGNVRSVTLPLGAAGVLTTANITITANNTPYTKAVSIRPQDVALVVEPRATTPPLYPGKAAEPLHGNVRLIAVTGFKNGEGGTLDSSSLSYIWTVDGARQADASGIGKNTIVVATPAQYRNRIVSVVVQSQDGALVSGSSLSLAPQLPTVRLYENDPLLGIRFDHALSNSYTLLGAESTLYGALFSFPMMNGVPAVNWYLNGASAQAGSSITLRPTGSGQGSATLSFVAVSDDTARATMNLSLSFGAATKTNLFGL